MYMWGHSDLFKKNSEELNDSSEVIKIKPEEIYVIYLTTKLVLYLKNSILNFIEHVTLEIYDKLFVFILVFLQLFVLLSSDIQNCYRLDTLYLSNKMNKAT